MSAINLLFTLDTDGNFVINRPEAKKIKEFAILFERDKGSDGDFDGKKKRIANAEIFMIYLIYDIRSTLYNLSYSERFDAAKVLSSINPRWKVDKQWQDAADAYKREFELTAVGKGYAVAERAYFSVTKDTAEIQEELLSIKEILKDVTKRLKKTKNTGEEDVTMVSILNEAIALKLEITKLQKDMIANIEKFPKLKEIVKQLGDSFAEEGGNLRIKVGGEAVNDRED